MKNVFETTDKTGRKIRMTKRQWDHITEKHSDMVGKEEEIKKALIKPDAIIPHKFDDMSTNYYLHNKNEKAYLLVSVKIFKRRRICYNGILHAEHKKKMKSKKIELNYDPEADLLEIFIGNPVPSHFNEIDDDLFEGHSKETKELTGYKIFNLNKRKQDWMKSVKISLPANVRITS